MAQRGGSLYNTVMSYVPGTEDYRKSTQHSEEEHHSKSNAPGSDYTTGVTGNQSGTTTDQGLSGGNQDSDLTGTGKAGGASSYGTGHGYDSTTGTGTGTGQYTSGQDKSIEEDTGGYGTPTEGYGSGTTIGSGNGHGSRAQIDDQDTGLHGSGTGHTGTGLHSHGGGATEYGSGTTGTQSYGTGSGSAYNTGGSDYSTGTGTGYGDGGTKYGSESTGAQAYGIGSGSAGTGATGAGYGEDSRGQTTKPHVDYEDADETGTHHSGYNPKTSSQDTYVGQDQDDGVRGAPIEGENVKGYAIGSQIGSGDTENPTRPGDPTGQVAGSHLEYGPKETDTRDATGRGTVGNSKGTGDSSFANVKTSDGKGNSSHVVTRQSTSHMTSSSVTQL